ncbi:hypothetical protein CONCODRAFT_167671 [Conidiobolus coronatus NRRL 28638]|uniref:F-box domain-containing protein n=1 Tax=Conidiobolus coronatus (strain ATCC 28846 / CBS 209.66 / NRRL 28638) TaxID=796925 RepID=A0A137NX69_CONC2|nr:hypothetical protein CONCODRAFT_167671 [Conidiobolus coronatus NRRL 28638]|eukprot:KXN67239.1 hypothetical protein CONCODRAFT_167671 [Conidiobolus coronatus NRRL 28638]
MNAINWNLILQKPEFYEYLPIIDIIQLGFANKLIRERLKSTLFSRFNIAKYFNKEYEGKIDRDLEYNDVITWSNYYDKFLRGIKLNLLSLPHKQFVKHLFYNETTPLSFINLYIEIFPNLTHLEFIMVKVPFESILNIFTSITNLEYLNLHLLGIIKLKNDNYNGSDLIFPSSIKSLKFGNLQLIISKLDNYPNLLNYDNA